MLSFALALLMMAPVEAGPYALQNAGFEASPDLAGWTTNVRPSQEKGRAPTVTVDRNDARGGRQSLLMDAPEAASASATQRIFLPVGSLWRASVWIKTQSLSPANGGGAQGNISIETPGGEIASSQGRSGTTPWQNEEVSFRVPSPGYIDLTLRGVNGGIGRVWFDDVRMEAESSDPREDIRISNQHATKRPIDAKQQGQFIELLCNLIPSIVAQQVVSTSFEDAPPCHVAYKQEVDEPYRPWYPDGAVEVAQYSFRHARTRSVARARRRLCCPRPTPAPGSRKTGFTSRQGVSYKLRLHMRGEGNVPGLGFAPRRRPDDCRPGSAGPRR